MAQVCFKELLRNPEKKYKLLGRQMLFQEEAQVIACVIACVLACVLACVMVALQLNVRPLARPPRRPPAFVRVGGEDATVL